MNYHMYKTVTGICALFLTIICLTNCTDPIIESGYFVIGQEERMTIVTFDPPMQAYLYSDTSSFKIDLDNDSIYEFYFYTSSSGPTGCRPYETFVTSRLSENIFVHSTYEEHQVYYKESITEEFYEIDGVVEKDSTFSVMRTFNEISDSIEGMQGIYVPTVYAKGDTAGVAGDWQGEFGLRNHYIKDNTQFITRGWACWMPEKTFTRNDTIINYFTDIAYEYRYNNLLVGTDGKYIVFKWDDGKSERIGWLKLRVEGVRIIVYEYAVERGGF